VDVNRPDVVAELTDVFLRYEKALVHGDNETLVAMFWADTALVRFGLADQQRGIEQLRAWRMAQPATPGRQLRHTAVTTFGRDFGVVTTEFDVTTGYDLAAPTLGRQSQTWVRTPAGWRIVTAHVSWPDPDTPP
jgi:hypothetical protein